MESAQLDSHLQVGMLGGETGSLGVMMVTWAALCACTRGAVVARNTYFRSASHADAGVRDVTEGRETCLSLVRRGQTPASVTSRTLREGPACFAACCLMNDVARYFCTTCVFMSKCLHLANKPVVFRSHWGKQL